MIAGIFTRLSFFVGWLTQDTVGTGGVSMLHFNFVISCLLKVIAYYTIV